MNIDLHIHSTISDGTMSPSEIVSYAAQVGLSAIAITDHDTVDGIDEAVAAGLSLGVEVVSGIELSVMHGETSVHLLGYLFDHHSKKLLDALKRLQEGRARRNERILSLLTEMDVDVSHEELKIIAGQGECGRPHIAKLLMNKNIVKTMDEAFERFLGRGAPAYASRFIYSAEEAIRLIRSSGGLAVLAHPSLTGQEPEAFAEDLNALVAMGLDGVEVYYPSHSRKFRKQLMAFAKQHGLLLTGGSDFHGSIRPGTSLAGGKNVSVPAELLHEMKEKVAENHRWEKEQGAL